MDKLTTYLVHATLCPGVCLEHSEICKDCESREATACARDLKEKLLASYIEQRNRDQIDQLTLTGHVTNVLRELGVPANIKGFQLLRTALVWAVRKESIVYNMMSELYPQLAAAYNTTASRAERNVRHAIESAWNRSDPDTQYKYFGNTVSYNKDKPTNGEFISIVADKIRFDMQMGVCFDA